MLIARVASRRPPELEIATAFLGVSRVPVQKSLLATKNQEVHNARVSEPGKQGKWMPPRT